MRIGFIGLGNMGAPMAGNLARAGHRVAGFDTAGVTLDGVEQAPSLESAAAGSDVLITMLPDGAALDTVHRQALPSMRKGALLLDCSTVDVDSAKAAHRRAGQAELLSIDAPVSGGIGGATAGTLTFMVGGSERALELAGPLLDVMGQRTVHCGPGGSGQAAKICNNLLLGISMIGACEAFSLGQKLGLAPERLFDVVSTSSGSCWSVNAYCPVPGVGPSSPADNGYAPGFAAELMLKDLGLGQQAAEQVDAATPMAARARALYAHLVEHGGRGQDFSAMLPALAAATRGEFDV